MTAIPNRQKLSKLNVTEEKQSFPKPDCGALYIPAGENFQQIRQSTLNEVILYNSSNPFKFVNKYMLELNPEDIFAEKSLSTLQKAREFVKDFFSHFFMLDSQHRENILERLSTFNSLISSGKKINLRFEIISGNSCKRRHSGLRRSQ